MAIVTEDDIRDVREKVASWRGLRGYERDDILADAFFALCRQPEPIHSPARWLLRAAKLLRRDYRRSRHRHATTTPLHETIFLDRDLRRAPSSIEDYLELQTAVQEALSTLSEQQRQAIELCDLAEMPEAEAARMLRSSRSTVKSWRKRGRLCLAKNVCLQEIVRRRAR